MKNNQIFQENFNKKQLGKLRRGDQLFLTKEERIMNKFNEIQK